MKKISLILCLFVFTILILPLCNSFFGDSTTSSWLHNEHGVPNIDWYSVEQWEIDYCTNAQKYGTEPEETAPGVMVEGDFAFSHNYVVSIQAEINDLFASAGLDIGSSVKIYELSWFVRPTHEGDLNYEVYVAGIPEPIATGAANYYNPGRGYWAQEVNDDLKILKAWITFSDEDDSEKIEVNFEGAKPLVETPETPESPDWEEEAIVFDAGY